MNHGTQYAYNRLACRCDECKRGAANRRKKIRRENGAVEAGTASLRALAAAFERAEWMKDARCRGMSPSMFFPERGAPTEKALAVCASCGVSDECLAHALATHEAEGVWGGKSARQRRSRGRNRVAPCARGGVRALRVDEGRPLPRHEPGDVFP